MGIGKHNTSGLTILGPRQVLYWLTTDPNQMSPLVFGCACPPNVLRFSSLTNWNSFPGA